MAQLLTNQTFHFWGADSDLIVSDKGLHCKLIGFFYQHLNGNEKYHPKSLKLKIDLSKW